jgi:hypothetical protein
MQLSELKELSVAIFTYEKQLGRFILLERAPRYSKIQYEKNNKIETFSWDSYNPEIEYMVKDKLYHNKLFFQEIKCSSIKLNIMVKQIGVLYILIRP